MNMKALRYPVILPVVLIGVVIALAWLLLPNRGIDAQTAIQNACEDAERATSGVISMSGIETRGSQTKNSTWEIRFSGENRSWHIQDTDLKLSVETYFIGDTVYNRQQTAPDVWGEWELTTLDQAPSLGPVGRVDDLDDASPVFCGVPGLTDHKFLGDQTVGGVEVKHFSAEMDEEVIGEGNQVDWEFWVNSDGQMTQFKIDESYSYGQDIEVTGVVSKLGETIDVQAPVVAAQATR